MRSSSPVAAGRPLSSRTEHGRVPAAQPWTLSPSRGARCPQRLLCQAGALTSGSLVSSGSITILLWEAQSSVLGRLELAADFSISCCVQRHLQAERGPGGFCTVPVGGLLLPCIFPRNAEGATAARNCWGRKALAAPGVSLLVSDGFVGCGFGHSAHPPTTAPPGTAPPALWGFPRPTQGFNGAKEPWSSRDSPAPPPGCTQIALPVPPAGWMEP